MAQADCLYDGSEEMMSAAWASWSRRLLVAVVAVLAAAGALAAWGGSTHDIGPLETRLSLVPSWSGGVQVDVPPRKGRRAAGPRPRDVSVESGRDRPYPGPATPAVAADIGRARWRLLKRSLCAQ